MTCATPGRCWRPLTGATLAADGLPGSLHPGGSDALSARRTRQGSGDRRDAEPARCRQSFVTLLEKSLHLCHSAFWVPSQVVSVSTPMSNARGLYAADRVDLASLAISTQVRARFAEIPHSDARSGRVLERFTIARRSGRVLAKLAIPGRRGPVEWPKPRRNSHPTGVSRRPRRPSSPNPCCRAAPCPARLGAGRAVPTVGGRRRPVGRLAANGPPGAKAISRGG